LHREIAFRQSFEHVLSTEGRVKLLFEIFNLSIGVDQLLERRIVVGWESGQKAI